MATTPTPLIWQNATKIVNEDAKFGGTTIQFKDGNGRIYYVKTDNVLYDKDATVVQGHWQDMTLGEENKEETKQIKLLSMAQPVPALLYSLVVVHNDETGFDKMYLVREDFDTDIEETIKIRGLNKEEPRIIKLSRYGANGVKVRYLIPEGNWDYVRLVYKPESAPESVSDGSFETITGDDRIITDLQGLTRYYFVIFAKDTSTGRIVKSEPKDIITGNSQVIAAFTETVGAKTTKTITVTEEVIVKE